MLVGRWTEGWGSLLAVSCTSVSFTEGTECGKHMRRGGGVLRLPQRWTEVAGMLERDVWVGGGMRRCH